MISLVMPHLKRGADPGAGAGAGGFGGFQGGGNGSYQEFHFNGENMDDIFGDIFGNMFHGSHGESRGFGSNGTYEHFTGNGGGHSQWIWRKWLSQWQRLRRIPSTGFPAKRL